LGGAVRDAPILCPRGDHEGGHLGTGLIPYAVAVFVTPTDIFLCGLL